MQITSRAYKTEQKNYLRNEQYVNVYLGVISKEAQANAAAYGDFTIYSDEQAVFENNNFEAYYGTAEENMTKCDSSQFFMPRDTSAFALYQGAVTQDILGSITFRFGSFSHLNIKGLTIDFGDYYPTEFEITNGYAGNTYIFENDSPGEWTTENEFLNTDYIKITPISMVGGHQRLRILSILFGLGFMFDNTSLISTSWKSEVAHLSDSLPSKTFSFTIDNLNRKFSADNPHSFVAFLEEQQKVEFEYGRKLDDGTIYKIPGGRLNLTSWSSDDTQAKFTAVGNMEYSVGTYDKGRYYPDGISLYQLAVDVCEDAGFKNYIIDSYLKKVITHNPLPVEKHKNLLQLIANASMAILRETRSGQIEIVTSFNPDITSITSDGHMGYSDLQSLVSEDAELTVYGTSEKDYVYADGHQMFLPRDSAEWNKSGYISSAVSNEDGIFEADASDYLRFVYDDGTITGITFDDGMFDIVRGWFYGNGISVSMNESTINNPNITIKWDASWTFYNLTLLFPDVFPLEIRIHTFKDDTRKESFTVEDEIGYTTVIQHDFYDLDTLVIEFTKTNPYQRIHLGRIEFGDITDYSIDYRDMSSSPVAVKTDFIKNVNVVYTEFSYGDEVKTLSTVETVAGSNTVSVKKACHSYSLAYKEKPDPAWGAQKYKAIYCDELPNLYTAKADERYLIADGDYYQMYAIEQDGSTIIGWQFLGNVREEIIDYFTPEIFEYDVIYLISETGYPVYETYMKIPDEESQWRLATFGTFVRGELEIVDSGAYFVTFTSSIPEPVVISGIEFNVSEQTYTKQMHEIGTDKTANNILIDNIDHAIDESEWLADYYNNDVEYKISYRGEPALDPDDMIYIENKFVEKNLIRITSTQIDTSTGMSMSCTLNGRRISYVENSQG